MPLDDVMRQFADMVGRALARRWLRLRGLTPQLDSEPRRKRRETLRVDRRPPSQGPTTPASQT
jgi:hypothetical protein